MSSKEDVKKYFLKEFEYYDGECFLTFNIVGINFDKKVIEIAITNRGKITVQEFDLFQDSDGNFYFEFGLMLEKIKLNDFEETE